MGRRTRVQKPDKYLCCHIRPSPLRAAASWLVDLFLILHGILPNNHLRIPLVIGWHMSSPIGGLSHSSLRSGSSPGDRHLLGSMDLAFSAASSYHQVKGRADSRRILAVLNTNTYLFP